MANKVLLSIFRTSRSKFFLSVLDGSYFVRSFELLSPVRIKVISQDLYERILNFVEMLMTQLLRETDTTLTVTACGWRLHMADPVVEEEVDIAGATAEAMVVEEDTEEDLAVEEEVEVDVLVHHPEDQTTELWCQVRSDPKFQTYKKTSVTQVAIDNKRLIEIDFQCRSIIKFRPV